MVTNRERLEWLSLGRSLVNRVVPESTKNAISLRGAMPLVSARCCTSRDEANGGAADHTTMGELAPSIAMTTPVR